MFQRKNIQEIRVEYLQLFSIITSATWGILTIPHDVTQTIPHFTRDSLICDFALVSYVPSIARSTYVTFGIFPFSPVSVSSRPSLRLGSDSI